MILAKTKYEGTNTRLLINDRAASNRLASVLIIVPTNRKSRALKKELIRLSDNKVKGSINIDTLGTFAQKMYSSLDLPPIQFLSEAASAVLMKKCFNTAGLKYFNSYKSEVPSGTLSRIKNIISEYKRHGISPSQLYTEALKLEGSEKLKAEDIALIYNIYNDECRKSSSGEMGDIYARILDKSAEEFSNAFTALYPEVDLVIVNGFDEFTAPEVDIINSIALPLLMEFDYNDDNPGLFSHLKECYERFTAKGFHITGTNYGKEENSFRELLRKEYFNGVYPPSENNYNITELIALNREKEVEIIAKEIKELITSGKADPSRICVAFNLIQNYSPIIRDKFPLYGIPFNLTDRIPLSSAGPVTALLSFFEIIENDFYYKNIFRSLSSGFIKLKNVTLSDLITTASELKIISGCDTWQSVIEEALKLSEKRKYITYNNALTSIVKLKEILAPLQADMSISAFRNTFFGIIDELRIPHNILSFNTETEVMFKALSAFYDTLSELFMLLRKEYGDNEKFPLSFFLENIRTAAENTRFNVTEKPEYGIQITNLNEIRGLSFDYLFIGGLTDGELPTRYTPEIFFSGSYVIQEWKHQTEERYRFYQSLCTWEKGLYLSHPLQDETKELAESNFLSELKNLTKITAKKEKDYSSKIFSTEELQDYAGRNIDNTELTDHLPGINAGNIRNLIETLKSRSTAGSESAYNGYIALSLPEDKRELLNLSRDKVYSASQLEIYAKCPFRFFLEKVLYLNVTEEPSEDMESYELGNLLHKILFLTYTRLREKDIVLYKCNDEVFKEAEEILFTTADEVIEESASKSPLNFLEIEKIKGFNGNRKKSILYTFLTEERENNGGYQPYDFEVPFGNIESEDGRKTELPDFQSGDVKLRGKIDRIDVNVNDGYVRVTDYKLTGKKISAEDIESGLSLQLPLYLYAAKRIVEKKFNKEFNPAGADIFSLKYKEGDFGRHSLVKEKKLTKEELIEEYEKIISISRKHIEEYTTNIAKGIFHPSLIEKREEKACKYCEFNSVCRIEEIS
jgi:ATP-dependent helicase/nuclease subunit B